MGNSKVINLSPESRKKNQSQSIYILIFSILIMVLAAIMFTQNMSKIKVFVKWLRKIGHENGQK